MHAERPTRRTVVQQRSITCTNGEELMNAKLMSRLATLGLFAAVAAGCTDLSPGVQEDVDVTMQRTDDVIVQAVGGWLASVSGGTAAAAAIDPDTVEALAVRVTDIEFLPEGGDEENDGAWISLGLPEPVVLDLKALPTEGDSPLVIASGSVDVGSYRNVRLFTDSASVRFKGTIEIGLVTYPAGEDILVTIPSGPETGLKTDASFEVVEDAEGNVNDVDLLFSEGSTFQNVTATGADTVILAPVIRGAPATP